MKEKGKFFVWIIKEHLGEDSPKGDLAADMLVDARINHLPVFDMTVKDWLNHLNNDLGISDYARRALCKCILEYRKVLKVGVWGDKAERNRAYRKARGLIRRKKWGVW